MPFKIVCGIIAVVLLTAFIAPVAFKLKQIALFLVGAIGLTMVVVDLWQSIRSKED